MIFESALLAINDMMLEESWLAYPGCFLWGLVSTLLSPCHLASIPLILGYIAGQEKKATVGGATLHAVLFSLGLFVAIVLVGVLCSLAGRMLGDVPAWLYFCIGAALVAVGIGMARMNSCSMPSATLRRLNVKGYSGAFALGGMYGMLSGVCTFGFLAPILAVVTVMGRLWDGVLMATAFAVGHCLPVALAGSGLGLAESCGRSRVGGFFRSVSCWVIVGVGLYFLWRGIRFW